MQQQMPLLEMLNKVAPVRFRLVCMMCKRDFRSLPALNGHMRSHSGVRSACVSKVSASQAAKCCPLWLFVALPSLLFLIFFAE